VSTVSPTSDPRPPQLIPLFDFQDLSGVLHSSSSAAPNHVSGLDDNSRRGAIQITSTIAQHSTTTNSTSLRVSRRLTEDQLAQLDTLTRESINLRLRILDGVSATLNECIDDLMELRSALPVEPTPSTTGASGFPSPSMMTPSAGSKEEENFADDKGKGKEKAPDTDISMPAGEEPFFEAVQHEGVDY